MGESFVPIDPLAAEMRAEALLHQKELIHNFVDVSDIKSYRDYESYLGRRPGSPADLPAPDSHYETTLPGTRRQHYEAMSAQELAKELAEADLAGDRTKIMDIGEVYKPKVAELAIIINAARDQNGLPAVPEDEIYNYLDTIRQTEKEKLLEK